MNTACATLHCPSLVHAIHLIDLLHNTHVVNAKKRSMNGMPCILRKDAMHCMNSIEFHAMNALHAINPYILQIRILRVGCNVVAGQLQLLRGTWCI